MLLNNWHYAVRPSDIAKRLAVDKNHETKAVLLVHTDTATGTTSGIEGVPAAFNEVGHPALLLVDTVTSLMTGDFRMDEWGVDVAVSASQKGLMLPPGLGFCVANEKAIDLAKNNKIMPKSYWDWIDRMTTNEIYRVFCVSAPKHFLSGLRESIDPIKEEGVDNVFSRHKKLARAIHAAINKWSEAGALGLFAIRPDERANSVSTVFLENPRDPKKVYDICRDQFNVILGNGLGQIGA
ncbi:MAG: hypothetical protein CBB68_02690 [Rhodospirillaceae bacterium TMED8]|nr:hypothetical protein [Magnetovibrio sp.]OUT52282.1 MAG: hypothetical protein CBB68_02690 [Rhodospirillaceae bacterium TMED8]